MEATFGGQKPAVFHCENQHYDGVEGYATNCETVHTTGSCSVIRAGRKSKFSTNPVRNHAAFDLLVNAIEAVATSDTAVRETRIDVQDNEAAVVITIGDSGPGLAATAVDDPASSTLPSTKKPGGTGMGLHIVRAVLANHRGRLELGHSPLGGAEFRMVLPKT